MLNYGSSITTSFPTTFCSSPAHLTCQLCNSFVKELSFHNGIPYSSVTLTSPSSNSSSQPNINKLEKCTHCGVNICSKCFYENQESINRLSPHNNQKRQPDDTINNENYNLTKSQNHYQLVKKEFKQMYNYSKDIVEKLHLLNNTIKIEETTISELNLIKHQVNTKALELIKQINQEKDELLQQIENVKKKYEEYLVFLFLFLNKFYIF
jgi:hypothetical protein